VPSRRAPVAHSDTYVRRQPPRPPRVKALRHGTMAKKAVAPSWYKPRCSALSVRSMGGHGNMTKCMSDLRGDCPKRNHPQMQQRCDLICPDLPKVL
jgi:hypothetical protein